MALYRPDHRYIEAMKIVEELGDSEKDKAIKYYIEKNKEWHQNDKEKIKKYEKFFQSLNSLLPKSGMKYN